MSLERKLLSDLLLRADQLVEGLDEAAALLGPVPETVDAFEALELVPRTAATALLKRVEQLEDVLVRVFRTSLALLGQDVSGLYVRDLANAMEREGVVPSAAAWMGIVKLRNQLVHEYPLAPAERLTRLQQAVEAGGVLKSTVLAAHDFISRKDLLGAA